MTIFKKLAWLGLVGLLVAAAACAPTSTSMPGPPSSPLSGVIPSATHGSTADLGTATALPAPPTATATVAAPAATKATETISAGSLTPPASTPMALDKIVADLARRLGAPASNIQLISVESAEMSPPDLGCSNVSTASPVLPAQVIGQVVRLRASGVDYLYHAQGRLFAYCGPG